MDQQKMRQRFSLVRKLPLLGNLKTELGHCQTSHQLVGLLARKQSDHSGVVN